MFRFIIGNDFLSTYLFMLEVGKILKIFLQNNNRVKMFIEQLHKNVYLMYFITLEVLS